MGGVNVTAKGIIARDWAPVTKFNWWKSIVAWPVEIILVVTNKGPF
jgi:hypothetical protein